ncbi:alpha/beta hydrolase [Agrobacterium sp. a22-2]|uniref:alpha/beta fold hydrolase n=1 Tax=Agrobacterium sp. a22-2 TaxID=2283840 RepID=UPI001444D35B|nr:alpha/beta hydrolase [Agrobacterium sp. a22-2]NKN35490.1 alpha/beta hydrolase [Agrobacterium sp. a22-2]
MDPVLHETPGNPIPANHIAGYFEGHGGVRLRYAVFRAKDSIAKGTVVLLHGRNEYIEKYFETIRELNAQGLWVATFDLRGQGLSERLLKDVRHGHVRRFADYERDLDIFLEKIVLPDTRLPFFLLAHSTGGLIALSSAPRLANRIDRMVLSAPFVGLGGQKLSPRKIFALSMLATLAGLGGRPLSGDPSNRPFAGNPLTSDPVRFQRNAAAVAAVPGLSVGAPTARWLYEAQKVIRRISDPQHLMKITIPTVLIAPMRDGVVPYIDQERMAQQFRAAQLVAIPGARHEILQESDRYRAQAMAAIAAFIPGSDPDVALEASESGEASAA